MRSLYCSKHYLHLNVQRFIRHKWQHQNEYILRMHCFKNKLMKHLRWRLLIINTVLPVQISAFLQFHIISILPFSSDLNHGSTSTTNPAVDERHINISLSPFTNSSVTLTTSQGYYGDGLHPTGAQAGVMWRRRTSLIRAEKLRHDFPWFHCYHEGSFSEQSRSLTRLKLNFGQETMKIWSFFCCCCCITHN